MSVTQAMLLGIVQGLTEFLPVSSSGHLVLAGNLTGLHQSLAFDVALHVGTLLAVLVVFGKDYLDIANSFWSNRENRLGWILAVATVPAVVFGVLVGGLAETAFRSNLLVATTLIGVAVVMLVAERASKRAGGPQSVNFTKGLAIGLAQAAAIVPGVSRAGATITAGLFAGLTRESATRFSFLLSGPVIAGAALKVLLAPSAAGEITAQPVVFAVGAASAAVSGFLAIKFMLSYLAKHSLNAFAYYRIALGVIVLAVGLV